MPKRSTPFQKIITYIATKLAPAGATVRESVELRERGVQRPREIDTVIEANAGLTKFCVAVEARERSRKDDIEWIDGLIGKYAGASVDRVVAVSRSGFSEGARQKAASHNIELLSPKQLQGTDWPAGFKRLGFGEISAHLWLMGVRFRTTPPIKGPIPSAQRLRHTDDDGKPVFGSVKEFVKELLPVVTPLVKKKIPSRVFSLCKTIDDLRKTARIECTVPLPRALSLAQDDTWHRVAQVDFIFELKNEIRKVDVEHQLLGDKAMMSSARIHNVSVLVGQTAESKEGKLVVDRRRQHRPTKSKTTRRRAR
jgi:hypothetical protein